MSGKNQAEELLYKAYESLKAGSSSEAEALLREALKLQYDHSGVLFTLKCLTWWLDKFSRLDGFSNACEKGEYILAQWKPYYTFLGRLEEETPDGEESLSLEMVDFCQYAVKRFVYSKAVKCFLELLEDRGNQEDPALLLQTGRCCKGAGNWDEALTYLELASSMKRDDSAILSELADVNALLGEARAAKVLFREAFFIDPQEVNLLGLESEMILQVRNKVGDLGYTGTEAAEWIPIWGCLWGVFSIKRELKPVELGRLKQSILSLENELRSMRLNLPHIKPRLLNRYFWLIDHYEYNRDASTLGIIEETMLKIQCTDPVVYKEYRT